MSSFEKYLKGFNSRQNDSGIFFSDSFVQGFIGLTIQASSVADEAKNIFFDKKMYLKLGGALDFFSKPR